MKINSELELQERDPVAPEAAEQSKKIVRSAAKDDTPVVIFHGNDNALSLARCLGRRKIPVYALAEEGAVVHNSRYVRSIAIPVDQPFKEASLQFLLGSQSDHLTGAVLLAASDDALEAIMEERDRLSAKYLLDISNVDGQRKMLDKLETYRAAAEAGVPTPAFWGVNGTEDIERHKHELVYPLLVKPIFSHNFQSKFPSGVKYLIANNYQEVVRAVSETQAKQLDVLLLEMIPGPDSNLCSYYTYIDEAGTPLFDFTKRIIRRFPSGMGLATYHITDHVEQIKELSLKLFHQAGLIGVANAEFKLDPRDQQLKLIECNARFTAANNLVVRAGIDIGSLVYNRLVGKPLPPLDTFQENLTQWDPLRDFLAFKERKSLGEIGIGEWLRSVARMHVFVCFQWSDPLPALERLRRRIIG